IGGLFAAWAASALAAAGATLAAAAPVILVAAAIGALAAGVYYAYQNWGWFRSAVDAVGRFLRDKLLPALQAAVKWIAEELVPALVNGFKTAQRVVSRAIDVIATVIEKFVGAVQAFWRRFGGTITSVVKTAFETVKGIIGGA